MPLSQAEQICRRVRDHAKTEYTPPGLSSLQPAMCHVTDHSGDSVHIPAPLCPLHRTY